MELHYWLLLFRLLPSEPPMDSRLAGGVTGVAVMIVVVFDIGVAVTPEVGATAICSCSRLCCPMYLGWI